MQGKGTVRSTYMKGFHLDMFRQCPFCLSIVETQDHHCRDVDVIVNLIRNKLDDLEEAAGGKPVKWCEHDDILARRTPYIEKVAKAAAARSRRKK